MSNNGHRDSNDVILTEALFSMTEEPMAYHEAMRSIKMTEWKQAMDEKYASLMRNGTWKQVETLLETSKGSGGGIEQDW